MAAILEQLFAQTETAVAVVDRAHCVLVLAWNNGAERAADLSADRGTETVLVVEDEAELRNVIPDHLLRVVRSTIDASDG